MKDLQKFLGFTSYYRRFINGFAKIAAPLHKLTQKGVKWEWSPQCEKSFCLLKNQLCKSSWLTLPDWNADFTIDCDASDYAIGAVLSCEINKVEKPIYFASRLLAKPEINYSTTRKELLAVVWALEKFRPYIMGKHVNVRSDHSSLQWLMNFKEPTGQNARWLEKLSHFNFSIIHRKGNSHANADALSRPTQCNHTELMNHTRNVHEKQDEDHDIFLIK